MALIKNETPQNGNKMEFFNIWNQKLSNIHMFYENKQDQTMLIKLRTCLTV